MIGKGFGPGGTGSLFTLGDFHFRIPTTNARQMNISRRESGIVIGERRLALYFKYLFKGSGLRCLLWVAHPSREDLEIQIRTHWSCQISEVRIVSSLSLSVPLLAPKRSQRRLQPNHGVVTAVSVRPRFGLPTIELTVLDWHLNRPMNQEQNRR